MKSKTFIWKARDGIIAETRFKNDITKWIKESTKQPSLFINTHETIKKICDLGFTHIMMGVKTERLKPIDELWNYVAIPLGDDEKVELTIKDNTLINKIIT